MSFLLICFFKPRFYFSSTARSDTSMAPPPSAGASRFTSPATAEKAKQNERSSHNGSTPRRRLVPVFGARRAEVRSAHTETSQSNQIRVSLRGETFDGGMLWPFERTKELQRTDGWTDGGEGNACLVFSTTRGIKRVTKTLLCPCGKTTPMLLFFFLKGMGLQKHLLRLAKASGSKSKHVASAPMLTVLAQHLLLVASVFKYFKNWYWSNAFANLPALVCVVLINVLIPNLGDVMHFNLNTFYFKCIF